MTTIDLNSDLGEGFGHWTLGDDDALLGVVTSANVACGFHAGDASIMRRVCDQAAERGVAIGAQVGYRDLPGFGRRFIDIEPEALTQDVIYQVGALEAFARVAGSRVRYVKPHGALYNAIVHHEEQAAAVVAGDRRLRPDAAGARAAGLGVAAARRARPGSRPSRGVRGPRLHARGDAGVAPAAGCGARTTPRRSPGAASRSRRASRSPTSTAARCALRPESICVHGDTAGAVEIAGRVRGRARPTAGVTVAPVRRPDAHPAQRHHRAPRRARRPRGGARPLRGPGGRRADGRGRHGAGGAHPAAGHRPGRHLPVRGRGRGAGDRAADRPRRLGRPRRDPGDLRRRGPRGGRASCSAATSPSWYGATRPPSGPWRSAASSPASAT